MQQHCYSQNPMATVQKDVCQAHTPVKVDE